MLPSISIPEWRIQAERFQLREAYIREQEDQGAMQAQAFRDADVEGAIARGAPYHGGRQNIQGGESRQGRRLDDGEPDILHANGPVHVREAEEPELESLGEGAVGGQTESAPETHRGERGSVTRRDEESVGNVLDSELGGEAVGAIGIGLSDRKIGGDNRRGGSGS